MSVVVVSYEALALTRRCVESLARQEFDDVVMEVIVVDNASTDGTAETLAREYPWAKVVRCERNGGFAGGVHAGLAVATGTWIMLLNNDATARPDTVRRLLHAARSAPPDVAAIAARVLLSGRFRMAQMGEVADVVGPLGRYLRDDGGDVRLINSTGNVVRTDGFGVDRGWLEPDEGRTWPTEVFGFCGAAALLRAGAVRSVGGMDERFFLYYEDSDLSWRLRRRGWQILYEHEAVVDHDHSASAVEGSDLFAFHDARNRLLMLTKNASVPMLARCLVRHLLTLMSVTVRRREPGRQTALRWRSFGSYLRLLPPMISSRRAIQRTAVVSRRSVESQLVPPSAIRSGGYRTGSVQPIQRR